MTGGNPMKKILTFSAALILGVCAFAGSANINKAHAEITDEQTVALQNLLKGYNDGGYTKKTQLYLTEECLDEMEDYFHAKANTPQRTTYYNEAETALLMGNYDGSFRDIEGNSGINSGYRNKGEGAEHFKYVDTTPTEANFFLEEKTQSDWNDNKTVGGYYQTLTSLANSIVKSDWVYNDGAYIHDISDLTIVDGEYNDQTLKKFQYFAAPMMLQNAYFSWHTIRVVEGVSFLSIRLYSTAASGNGKSTMVSEDLEHGEALISEARIYKGIHRNPEVTWTLKGSFDSWGDGEALTYNADLYIPEQYKITHTCAAGDSFKLNSGSSWIGFNEIENQTWFSRNNEVGHDNDAIIRLAGEYTIYWKPKANQMWIGVPNSRSVLFDLSACTSGNEVFYLWIWKGSNDGVWREINNNIYTMAAEDDFDTMIVVRMNASHASVPSWDAKWNQTGNITIQFGGKFTLSGYGSGDKMNGSF